MMRIESLTHVLAVMLCTIGPMAVRAADEPVVFAAASLRGVLMEAVKDYTPAPRISYGASGTLAQQVARGAPADLVILASPQWMDWLDARGQIGSARDFLTGRLVLIARSGPDMGEVNAHTLIARLAGGRLAIGQRRAVPAGSYARAWLTAIGAWQVIEPHLAEAGDVRAALAFVVRGAAPLGVVYASDAQAEPKVRVIYHIPPKQHPPIRYVAAARTAAGGALLHYLHQQREIFVQAGFGVPAP